MSDPVPTLPSEASPPPLATDLWLIRHAEVEPRYQRVFGGTIDMEISPFGREQALTLAHYLKAKRFSAVYASPMRRVQQTLAPLLSQGLPTPQVVPDFREVNFGDWTGLTWDEVQVRYGLSAFSWLDQLNCGGIPNCETVLALRRRIEPALQRILNGHAGHRIAIVCHGGVIRIMLALLLDLPAPKLGSFEIEYTSITRLSCEPGRTRLELLNFTPWRDLGR